LSHSCAKTIKWAPTAAFSEGSSKCTTLAVLEQLNRKITSDADE